MKKILGLDLGTNSIGWALVNQNFEEKKGEIIGLGSRIIPMTQDVLDNYGAGKPSKTQTAERTKLRISRHMRERQLLRRERLHRVLNILGFLPEHYAGQIDFEQYPGKFYEDKEPKIAWKIGKSGKYEFIFKDSFSEMLEDFRQNQPALLNRKNRNGEDLKIPYDWTIYFLRKKALNEKITKEELAWVILNFNQKRGYYQLRIEDEEEEKKSKTRMYFDRQVITDITDTGETYKGLKVLKIRLANGDIGKYFAKKIPDWIGTEKNIIATVDLDKDGNDQYEEDGTIKRRFSIPTEADWEKNWKLIKIKTEKDLDDSQKTVGAFIYDTLLKNPDQKIRGQLIRTIERKYYKEELKAILKKQIELQPELFSEDLYNDCVRELYRNNESHQFVLSKKDFVHLFVEDIIFYQRPLKSKKSSIGDCPLEFIKYKYKDENGADTEAIKHLKVIPKSNPYYQEFRIWKWMSDLRIIRIEDEKDVTHEFLDSTEAYESLFSYLYQQKEVEMKDVLKHLLSFKTLNQKEIRAEMAKYRWNYVYDENNKSSKVYPCNETDYEIRKRLAKVNNVPDIFLTPEKLYHLWHIIYSVIDKNEFRHALGTFAAKYKLDKDSFVKNFENFPPFKSEYGAYSEKAVKKMLALMRMGKFWSWDNIDAKTKERIKKILNAEYDETIQNRVREKAINLTKETDFQGLPEWLAKYIIYDKHSEATNIEKWKTPEDLNQYLNEFKQHSLRNPIVEQIVTETLRMVRDIWEYYGNGKQGFFDEIHIELGRDLKNPADERKRLSKINIENENTNLRIKALIMELKDNTDGSLPVENVRPYSPVQQEALKIY